MNTARVFVPSGTLDGRLWKSSGIFSSWSWTLRTARVTIHEDEVAPLTSRTLARSKAAHVTLVKMSFCKNLFRTEKVAVVRSKLMSESGLRSLYVSYWQVKKNTWFNGVAKKLPDPIHETKLKRLEAYSQRARFVEHHTEHSCTCLPSVTRNSLYKHLTLQYPIRTSITKYFLSLFRCTISSTL